MMRFSTLLCLFAVTLTGTCAAKPVPNPISNTATCQIPGPVSYPSQFLYYPPTPTPPPPAPTTTPMPTDTPTDAPPAPTTTPIPTDASTDAPTDTPTDTPTDAPTDAPTPQPPKIIPFQPRAVLYNAQKHTLFVRGTPGNSDSASGVFVYQDVKSPNPLGYNLMDHEAYMFCPPQSFDENRPTPSWDIFQSQNILVYTCQQTIQSTNITLMAYDIDAQQTIMTLDMTTQCDPTRALAITVDQAQGNIYVTCPAPPSAGCVGTNVWRVRPFATPVEALIALDSVECPNAGSVVVNNGMLLATCTDNDIIDATTGIRGLGWVIQLDSKGSIQALTNNATCPFPSRVLAAPYPYNAFILCQDGRVISPIEDVPQTQLPMAIILNSTIHCPIGTSIVTLNVNMYAAVIYAICGPPKNGPRIMNPPVYNTLIKRVLPAFLPSTVINTPIRSFPLPGCGLTRQSDTQSSDQLSIAVDQTSQMKVFVMCTSSSQQHAQVTQYTDSLTIPATQLFTFTQARHLLP